jgi:hypothetical protein
MNEQIAKIIDFSLFGTTDGDLIPDEDASVPVGEYRRLIREEAIPALVRAGLLRDPAELQARIGKALALCDQWATDGPDDADGEIVRIFGERVRAALSGPASPPATEPGFHFGSRVAWTDRDGDWHEGTLVAFFRTEDDEWWAVEDELGFVHEAYEHNLTRLRPAPTAGEGQR